MKDLHSDSYVDPVKVAAADLSLNPYAHSKMILKANAKKDGRDTNWELSDESKVISGKDLDFLFFFKILVGYASFHSFPSQ